MNFRLYIFLLILSLSINGFGQELIYDYPVTYEKFTGDIESIDYYSQSIQDFDTSLVKGSLNFIENIDRTWHFKEGKINKIYQEKPSHVIIFKYDSIGNILSKETNSESGSELITYDLNQDERKLSAYTDGELIALVFFDKNSNVLNRKSFSRGLLETINHYDDQLLRKSEYHVKGNIQFTEVNDYDSTNISATKRYDKNNNLIRLNSYSYEPSRQTITTVNFREGIKTTESQEINYFDQFGNLVKKYQLYYHDGKTIARITKIRITYRS